MNKRMSPGTQQSAASASPFVVTRWLPLLCLPVACCALATCCFSLTLPNAADRDWRGPQDARCVEQRAARAGWDEEWPRRALSLVVGVFVSRAGNCTLRSAPVLPGCKYPTTSLVGRQHAGDVGHNASHACGVVSPDSRVARAGAELVKKVAAVYEWKIGSDVWIMDLKNGSGAVKKGNDGVKADCTLTMDEAVFTDLFGGKLNAQQAFMQGKLKIGACLALFCLWLAVFSSRACNRRQHGVRDEAGPHPRCAAPVFNFVWRLV